MSTADAKINITGDASGFVAAAKDAQAELDKVIKATDDLAKAQQAEAKAADVAAKAAVKQAKSMEQAARAAEALTDIAIQQESEEVQLTRALEKKREEIRKLAAVSGDAESAEKALIAVEKQHADSLAALKKAQDKAADAAEKAAAAIQQAGNPLSKFSERADKVGSAAVKMRGALSTVSPEAGQMASAVDDAADLVEGLGRALSLSVVSMGAVGVAIAAAGAAYLYFTSQVAAAESAMAAASEEATRAQEAALKLGTLRLSVADKYAIATKKVTAKDLELRDGIAAVTAEYGPRIRAEQEALATAKESIASGKLAYMTIDEQAEVQAKAKAEINRATAAISGLTQEQGKYLDMTAVAILTEEKDTKAKKDKTKAVQGLSDAEKAAAERKEALDAGITQAIQDDARRWQERQAAEEQATQESIANSALAMEADKAAWQEREQAAADYAAKVKDEIASALDAVSSIADSASTMVGIQLDAVIAHGESLSSALETTRDQIAETQDLIAGLNTETVDAAKLSGKALVDAYTSGAVAAEDLSATQIAAVKATLDAEAAALEQKAATQEAQLKAEREAAREIFRIQQALQIASAVVSGAAFILQGGAQLGIPGAIAAGIAAATQVALIATAEPPSFHAGGIIGDSTRALPGEVVLNRSAVEAQGGPAAANALNSPQGRGAMGSELKVTIGRLESREINRTDIRGGGALPAYVRSETRRGTHGAGRSGRLASA